jgi:hypothetical protein
MPDTRKVRECVEAPGRATLKLGTMGCWRQDGNRAFTGCREQNHVLVFSGQVRAVPSDQPIPFHQLCNALGVH